MNAARARHLLRRVPTALEAAVLLTGASVGVRVLPSVRTTRLLGRPGPVVAEDRGRPDPRAWVVGAAVERVARLLPWKPKCLPQAIAARAMLRRRGIPSHGHLGVVGTEPLSAHAWVTVDGRVVQGGPVAHATEVALLR